jgi:hypothetical protein
MKNLVIAFACIAVAFIVKYLPTGGVGLSWRVDEHTHRATSFNVVFFWMLLGVGFLLVAVEVGRRLRTN